MFAEFGVLNYLTYLVGAIFIILVPGPNTFFLSSRPASPTALKKVSGGGRRVYWRCGADVSAFAGVATLIKTTPVLFNIVRYLGRFICCGWAARCSTRC